MHTRVERKSSRTSIGVLIVDDHGAYRAVAAEVVDTTPGFEVIASAASRATALACMASCRGEVDLVLMDVNLGVDDGVTLSAEIANEPGHRDIVLVSALALEDLPSNATSCGARGYIPKSHLSPLALRELYDGIYDWADGAPSSPR